MVDAEGPGDDVARDDVGGADVIDIDLGNLDLADNAPRQGPARPLEDTRARIAFVLLAILAGILVFLMSLLAFGRVSTEELVKLLGVLLAPIVGLVGAATGYYYGRTK
jgi:hypothetical protein